MRLYSRRLHLRSRILAVTLCVLILTFLLPYDNGLVLFFRWHLNTVRGALRPKDDWLHTRPRFPLDITDVGIIVKTGFSTQDRLLARLDAFEPGRDASNLVLVGDYATTVGAHFDHNGVQMPVRNALAGMIDSGALLSRPRAERLQYYWNLTAAIAGGFLDVALGIGRVYGWELDIMKASFA
jgi:hypothetical protein